MSAEKYNDILQLTTLTPCVVGLNTFYFYSCQYCAMKYGKDCAENFSPFYCALVISTNTHCGIKSSTSPLPKLAMIQNDIVLHLILKKIYYPKLSLLFFQINVSSI